MRDAPRSPGVLFDGDAPRFEARAELRQLGSTARQHLGGAIVREQLDRRHARQQRRAEPAVAATEIQHAPLHLGTQNATDSVELASPIRHEHLCQFAEAGAVILVPIVIRYRIALIHEKFPSTWIFDRMIVAPNSSQGLLVRA
jgi:hypothetical protein